MNTASTTPILPEAEMRRLGFTDHIPETWYRVVTVADEITLNITIDKKTGAYREDVLDEMFGQPYPYAGMMHVPAARQTRDNINRELEILQEAGLKVDVDHNAYRWS